jgi:hypothetical protein
MLFNITIKLKKLSYRPSSRRIHLAPWPCVETPVAIFIFNTPSAFAVVAVMIVLTVESSCRLLAIGYQGVTLVITKPFAECDSVAIFGCTWIPRRPSARTSSIIANASITKYLS